MTVYRFLLGRQGAYPESVVAALRVEREALDHALTTLHGLRLVHTADDQRIHPTDPAVGIERLIERRLAELSDASYRVAAARLAIPVLQNARREAAVADPPQENETIVDLAAIRERIDDLAFFARHEICSLQLDGPLTASMLESARPLDMRCLRRGVAMRTVVVSSAVEDGLTAAYLTEISRLGARVRLIDGPLDHRMLVYDRQVAIIPADPDPETNTRGAVVIRQPPLVANIVVLFDQLWSAARDFVPTEGRESAATPISAVEKQVLTLLATADKDEVGARELGISLRTYRRHVADLMTRLGAGSRFQAGMLAKEMGWL
ncbi:LuxR C-terminal-related transcriptional regulator [Kutzneria sp. CA-103260]|uniref:LuxR C-terminal-related transcriptional regulator n=1 Tax=Kutzneria sp. CA-103260 TaxID=2802641 RepID=UPI001BA5AF7F|nr:LuxR C-terminal-related transcriptional regulator [Kutzneria sp. CA-103260]